MTKTDAPDLIERLRHPISGMRPTMTDGRAAATALEAAQARIAELEGVLERIGSAAQFYSQPGTDGMASRYAHESHARLVHAALETANQDSHGTDQQHES